MKQEPSPIPDVLAPLRDRRRATTRQEIAEAALQLFERQGYDGTTVEQIADAAGVSLRTFYRYCSSKDDTLTFGLISGPARLTSAIRARRALPLLDAIIAAFVAETEQGSRRNQLQLVISTPALRSAWLSAGREAQDDLADVIRERDETQSTLQARARAAAISGVLTAVIEAWAFSDGPIEPLTREAMRTIAPLSQALAKADRDETSRNV
jgi:AcrR family transcriptional regulator